MTMNVSIPFLLADQLIMKLVNYLNFAINAGHQYHQYIGAKLDLQNRKGKQALFPIFAQFQKE